MIRSILALHPYSPVTKEHGDSTIRSDTITFSTLSPKISFIFLHNPSNAALSSSCFFFSSSVKPKSKPSLVTHINFLPSYSLNVAQHIHQLDPLRTTPPNLSFSMPPKMDLLQ